MIKIALIFPGQGAQKVGMGKDLYDQSPEARTIFDAADRIIPSLTKVIFEGPEEKLISTAYCQPAILTVSLSALEAFKAHPKFQNVSVQYAAGLSLGEYSALAAARVLSFEDTLKVVQKRSAFMEEAAKLAPGKMAAIIGFDQHKLNDICQETGAEVANFNSLEQIVITGYADKVLAASAKVQQEGGKVIPLAVSGAFHSSLMKSAAEHFKEALKGVPFQKGKFSVVTNVDGKVYDDPDAVRQNLALQITSSVQWVESVRFMAHAGIKDFIEIGPGRVLKGLVRKIDSNLVVHNIQTPADIEALLF